MLLLNLFVALKKGRFTARLAGEAAAFVQELRMPCQKGIFKETNSGSVPRFQQLDATLVVKKIGFRNPLIYKNKYSSLSLSLSLSCSLFI